MDSRVKELVAAQRRRNVTLDEDSIYAIVAYTFEREELGKNSSVYFNLNNALRKRKIDPDSFQKWQGYLYFLMYVYQLHNAHEFARCALTLLDRLDLIIGEHWTLFQG